MSLSKTQLDHYLHEGYVALDALVAPGTFDILTAEISSNIDAKVEELAALGKAPKLHREAPFSKRLALICADIEDEEARNDLWRIGQGKHHKTRGMFLVWTDPSIISATEQIIGPEILAHPQYNLRAKLPYQSATEVPWHQDLALLGPEAADTFMVNFWIPLVEAPMETGALQVIPGSHRWEVLPHESLGDYDGVRKENLPPHEIVDCPIPLGGALLIQSRTMHRSIPNTSDVVRWSLDLRYCDSRKPTGRENVPGFVVRSETNPAGVARDWHDWADLFINRDDQ